MRKHYHGDHHERAALAQSLAKLLVNADIEELKQIAEG